MVTWKRWPWSMGSSMENECQSRSLEASTRYFTLTEKKQTPSSWYSFQQQPVKKKLLPKIFGKTFLDSDIDFDQHIEGILAKTS